MSQYAREVKHILATLNEQGNEDGSQPQKQADNIIHVYHTTDGKVILSNVELDTEESEEPIIDSQPKAPTPVKAPPPFVVFCFLLLLFVLLDVADNQLLALMTPTATITITPNVRTLTLTSTAALGKQLSPITVSESQTVPTTGHGHQDSRKATGTVTFYNGQQTAQTVAQGTVFTGSDGVNIVTTQPAYIPAGNPSTGYGTVTVTAQAQQAGSQGNIQAGDVNTTLAIAVFVKNNQFSNGQDERDYKIVTPADENTAALKLKVTSSMTAALQAQLMPGQALQPTPCTPRITADHAVGDEASQVTISVSQTCTAIAYNIQELDQKATQLLSGGAVEKFGTGYSLYGTLRVTVTKATTQQRIVILSFTTQGTYLYQLNAKMRQRIVTLIAGENRLTALRQLATLPGINHASISGISDNQPLPDDANHIHLLIIDATF